MFWTAYKRICVWNAHRPKKTLPAQGNSPALVPFPIIWSAGKQQMSVGNSARMRCGGNGGDDKVKLMTDLNQDTGSRVLELLSWSPLKPYQKTYI